MAKLIVTFDGRELQQCAIGARAVTIGRLPDNIIVIDNPSVSGRHAHVVKEGASFVVEDLKSTNGTFVNDRPISRHTLVEGDVVQVGHHAMRFTQRSGDAAPVDGGESDRSTMSPGTIKQKSRLSGLDFGRPSQVYDAVVPKTAIPTARGRIGTIKVIAGSTGQSDYVLTAVTTMIGASETAQIRVKGWFKPKAAAAIARKGDGFTLTPMASKVTVNGARIDDRHDLANGDLIEVAGLTLQFSLS